MSLGNTNLSLNKAIEQGRAMVRQLATKKSSKDLANICLRGHNPTPIIIPPNKAGPIIPKNLRDTRDRHV